jgi:type I restriction enzyme S subunit
MLKEKRLVPQLRFSEFEGEWEKKKLSETAIFLDEKRKPIKSSDRNNMKGVYPYYGASGIIDYINDFIFDDELILLGEDGENILSRNSPLAFRVSGKCWINNHAHVIKPKNEINIDFLTINLELVNYTIYNTGTAQPKLNKAVCSLIPTFFPSLKEQQKIANFLTAIDNRIQTLEKKKTLLEQYKKGVMQEVFKQELRFKDDTSTSLTTSDGKAFPEWEFKNGNLLFKSISDKNHNSDLPILAVTQDQGAIPRHLIDYNIGVTTKSVSSYKVVQMGDFIISLRSFQGGIEYSNYKGICSPAYIILKPIKEMDKTFYKYYLKTPNYIQELTRKLEGIRDGKMVSYKYFSEIKLPYPSIEEQTKIANFLSAIDISVELVTKKIEHTKTYKKGLLQQMFV